MTIGTREYEFEGTVHYVAIDVPWQLKKDAVQWCEDTLGGEESPYNPRWFRTGTDFQFYNPEDRLAFILRWA